MNKLFLLDAMALIYRAHFAFAKTPRVNSKGVNTGAVMGFANTLLDLLKKEQPSHIAVAFDTPEPTFRHIEYREYKAQRDSQPEDITIAIPYIFRLLEAFNISILQMPGYEADDVIGTIAKQAKAHGDFEVYMMTPDKDYAQLVEPHIYLYKPAMFGNDVAVWGVDEVLAKWEIQNPLQVIDILALQGDAVDNVPGIPGIGEKTAIKLVQEFGSLENLLANVHQLKGKQRENVEKFAEQGKLSKRLATIDLRVPVHFDAQALAMRPMNEEAVRALFDELEFRTLKARLFKDDISRSDSPQASLKKSKATTAGQIDLFDDTKAAAPDAPPTAHTGGGFRTLADTPHRYYVIDSPSERQRLNALLCQQSYFCLDTETTGLDVLTAELVGISIALTPGEAYYLPVPEDRVAAQAVVDDLRAALEDSRITKIGQNIKYDLAVLMNYGIALAGQLWDTMLAHYLLEPDARHNMEVLAENYLQYSPVSIETLIGKKGAAQRSMRDVPLGDIKEYAAEDADITLQLYHHFVPYFTKQAAQEIGLAKIFYEVETPLIPVLARMERAGVCVDKQNLAEISEALSKDIATLETAIYNSAGAEFNIASPKQLGEVLFERLKLDEKAKKTKTGQYATGEEVLARLADRHPIVAQILEYRETVKLKNTYVDALPALIAPHDGRLHTTYQQAVASTGRLSSINPNLQNIPIRTHRGRAIRKAFVAPNPDTVLLSADYSQIELRIMAHFAQDATMVEAFCAGTDIHTATAAKIFKVSPQDVTPEMRRRAKTANFGIIYGISAHGLSQRLNIPRSEAADIINAYFTEFAAVKNYMDEVVNRARQTEYVETLWGRRRYLRNINSGNMVEKGNAERNAINAPIQGTAADMIKLAMIRIDKWLQSERLATRMLLQVHDELIFEVPRHELDHVQAHIALLMREALPLSVPVEVGIGVGQNWLEAH